MNNPDFWDFMMEGGDELLNAEPCSHCGDVLSLSYKIPYSIWCSQ